GVRGQGAGALLLLTAVFALVVPVLLQAQMPDPRMMHGQALPAGDLAPGTVTVRVVRESIANNLPGIDVELHGAGAVRRATTGLDGRAQFEGLPAGARVHVRTVVGGEP